jgi:putative heme-binding domain-containing protein
VRQAINDRDLDVRLAALHSVSLLRDSEAAASLTTLLQDQSPAIRRAAAEVTGKLELETAIPDLLRAASLPGIDRVLEHSITFALIEIGKPVDLSKVPQALRTPMVKRIAAIANDQMPDGHMNPQVVVPWLKEKDATLKQTALWLVSRHADWGNALADYLKEQLQRGDLSESERSDLVGQLAQFSANPGIQKVLTQTVQSENRNAVLPNQIALDAMRESGLKELPADWQSALANTIAEGGPALSPVAISVLRRIPTKGAAEDVKAALLKVIDDQTIADAVKVEAMAAMPGGISRPSEQQLQLLIANLNEEASVTTRSSSVDAITRSKLDSDALKMIADSIPTVGPLELNRLLGAFEHSSDPDVGMTLVAALKKSPVLTSLRVDTVKKILSKYPADVQSQAEELYAVINVEAGRQQEKLNELATYLSEGDVRRGQVVFKSQKAACSACHAMGYVGGNIGPDLSKIGKIRTERDLLEAVVFPSVSFVRSYEPILVLTKSGKQVNGLIRKETPDEITFATGAKEEVRVLRSDIDEIRPGTVSIMPAGLDTQLTRQQIADLIAFLKSRQ